MKTDIEIARSIELVKIKQVARETGIPVEHISNYVRSSRSIWRWMEFPVWWR